MMKHWNQRQKEQPQEWKKQTQSLQRDRNKNGAGNRNDGSQKTIHDFFKVLKENNLQPKIPY